MKKWKSPEEIDWKEAHNIVMYVKHQSMTDKIFGTSSDNYVAGWVSGIGTEEDSGKFLEVYITTVSGELNYEVEEIEKVMLLEEIKDDHPDEEVK